MMQQRSDGNGINGFLIGLVAGGAIGAGLAIAFAPRLASELRRRVTRTVDDLGDAASGRYREARARVDGFVEEVTGRGQALRDEVVDAVDGVTARGQAVRDDVADAVGRGAREVERFAMASKTIPEKRRS
jgi:gas vesicle protein